MDAGSRLRIQQIPSIRASLRGLSICLEVLPTRKLGSNRPLSEAARLLLSLPMQSLRATSAQSIGYDSEMPVKSRGRGIRPHLSVREFVTISNQPYSACITLVPTLFFPSTLKITFFTLHITKPTLYTILGGFLIKKR